MPKSITSAVAIISRNTETRRFFLRLLGGKDYLRLRTIRQER